MLEGQKTFAQEIYQQSLPYLQHFLLGGGIDRISNNATRELAGNRWFYELGIKQFALLTQAQIQEPNFPTFLVSAVRDARSLINEKWFFHDRIQSCDTQDALLQSLIMLGYEGGGDIHNYFVEDIISIAKAARWLAFPDKAEIASVLEKGIQIRNGMLSPIPESAYREHRRELLKKGKVVDRGKMARRARKLFEDYSTQARPYLRKTYSSRSDPQHFAPLMIDEACFQGSDEEPKSWRRIIHTLEENPEPQDNKPVYLVWDYI